MRLRPDDRRETASFNWTLWLKWILVTTLGWAAGLVIGVDPLIGAFVGLLQWIVLRTLVPTHAWWAPASGIGWAAGAAVVALLLRPAGAVLGPVVIGAGIGLAQWLVLRPEFRRAWWWIPVSALGWAVGLMGVLGASLAGAVAGAVTGIALQLLLRYPMGRANDSTEPRSSDGVRDL